MENKTKGTEKKIETSKYILYAALVFYAIAFIGMVALFIATGISILDMFLALQTLVLVVVGGYFGKSGYENKYKIEGSTLQQQYFQDDMEEEMEFSSGGDVVAG